MSITTLPSQRPTESQLDFIDIKAVTEDESTTDDIRSISKLTSQTNYLDLDTCRLINDQENNDDEDDDDYDDYDDFDSDDDEVVDGYNNDHYVEGDGEDVAKWGDILYFYILTNNWTNTFI